MNKEIKFENDKLIIEDKEVEDKAVQILEQLNKYCRRRKAELQKLLHNKVDVKIICNITEKKPQ